MSVEEDKRVFQILRPYCVNLSKLALAPPDIVQASRLQIDEALKEVYKNFSNSVSEGLTLSSNLADYIFVPLSYLLKQPNLPDAQINYILKIMTLLIRYSWSVPNGLPFVLVKQLFPLLTFLTGGSPDAKDTSEIEAKSDELKTSGSRALTELFKALATQKQARVYDFFSNVENLPALGHCVTVLLEFALNGKSTELQIESLNALSTLYFNLINDGEILSYILPGNVSTLTKIIASPVSKTHYTVLVRALDVLDRLLVIVYADENLKIELKQIESIEELTDVDFGFDEIQLKDATFGKVHRNKAWLKGTSSQVKMALSNIKKTTSHDKFEVRQKLYEFSQDILKHCMYSLNSSTPVIVEMIALLSKDERLCIDQKTVFKTADLKQREIISKILSNELNKYVESFKSVVQSSNEDKIISNITAIRFTIKQTSDNEFLMNKLVNSTISELSELINKANYKKKKVTSAASNVTDLMLISKEITNPSTETKPLTVYDQIMTKKIQMELASLFQTLGENINPGNIIEDILSDGAKTITEKGVSLWIANCLTQGYVNKVKSAIVVDEFIDFGEEATSRELMKPDFVFALLEYSKDLLDEVSEVESATQVIEQVSSVALDSIGIVADLLRSEFEHELVEYLYPVIESLASSSETTRNHAVNTSLIIADNLYSGSMVQLIYQNADYLVDSISFRLSNTITQRTTAILAVCVQIAGYQIIESFRDVMEIVFSLLDHYHGYDDICIGFFLLFEIIADEIRKKYLDETTFKKLEFFEVESSYKPWGMTSVNQLIKLLDKSKRDMKMDSLENTEECIQGEAGNIVDSDDEEEGSENEKELERKQMQQIAEEENAWTSPVPKDAYQLLQQVVYYGERLLTHPSNKLHTQILRTYTKALPIFATSSKHFLPIAASIWPVVSFCVIGSDPKVVILAAKVMEKIIKYSGSFISQRFLELWKRLSKNELLITASKQSLNSQKVVLPGINSKCYEALVDMLVEASNSLGRFMPDSVSEEIIRSCIGVVDAERFQAHSDIAWMIKYETYGTKDLQPIPSLHLGGQKVEFPV